MVVTEASLDMDSSRMGNSLMVSRMFSLDMEVIHRSRCTEDHLRVEDLVVVVWVQEAELH